VFYFISVKFWSFWLGCLYSGLMSLEYIRYLHLSVYLKKLSIARAIPNLKIG
jgi:hypothetical protein